MVTFDAVLPTLVGLVEESPIANAIGKVCVVRDLEGRVRLAIKEDVGQATFEVDTLEGDLGKRLARWFEPPILLASDKGERGRLANAIFAHKECLLWDEAKYIQSGSLLSVDAQPGRWWKMERRVSKADWLKAEHAAPPWPLSENAPKIVAFYSFKGGVGRTTLLASCAWQLARGGKRVVVIDLDVEAPGLGATFEVSTQRGLVDFIVDFIGTGHVDLGGLVAAPLALGAEADKVEVIPAGALDWDYFEKLARLDFVGSGLIGEASRSPVEKALNILLKALAGRKSPPEYILLDSRAGLHDMAGLSLHGLAHVDVLVSRASEQAYRGLDLTLHALGRRKSPDELLCVTIHAMAPPDPESKEAKEEQAEFRERSYAAFSTHIYSKIEAQGPEEEAPQLADDDSPHSPAILRRHVLLERFAQLKSAEEALFGESYREALARIVALCEPEREDAAGEDAP